MLRSFDHKTNTNALNTRVNCNLNVLSETWLGLRLYQ